MLLLPGTLAVVEFRHLLFVELPEKVGVSYPLRGEKRGSCRRVEYGWWSVTYEVMMFLAVVYIDYFHMGCPLGRKHLYACATRVIFSCILNTNLGVHVATTKLTTQNEPVRLGPSRTAHGPIQR